MPRLFSVFERMCGYFPQKLLNVVLVDQDSKSISLENTSCAKEPGSLLTENASQKKKICPINLITRDLP